MANLAVTIEDYVVGDDLEIERTVTGLTSAISVAWLTVKRYDRQSDDDAILQKRITTDDVVGTGQIEEAGGVDTSGELRFDLVPDDTVALGTDSWVYDIQVLLAGGQVYTIEKGTIGLTDGVTAANS